MAKITIIIDPVGRPSWEAEGFVGESCKHATEALEAAFAGAAMETEDKDELYQTNLEEEVSAMN